MASAPAENECKEYLHGPFWGQTVDKDGSKAPKKRIYLCKFCPTIFENRKETYSKHFTENSKSKKGFCKGFQAGIPMDHTEKLAELQKEEDRIMAAEKDAKLAAKGYNVVAKILETLEEKRMADEERDGKIKNLEEKNMALELELAVLKERNLFLEACIGFTMRDSKVEEVQAGITNELEKYKQHLENFFVKFLESKEQKSMQGLESENAEKDPTGEEFEEANNQNQEPEEEISSIPGSLATSSHRYCSTPISSHIMAASPVLPESN